MKVRIIIDSTADVSPALAERFHVVNMAISFGDEEYIDGVNLSHKEFYEKLIESDVMPKTSQATPDMFAREFRAAQEAGESAVAITLSSALSGTYQSAVIAAQDFDNVYVVDSLNVALGSGILAERALQLADGGMDAASIARVLDEEKGSVHLIAMLDTLEYLKRGGRISRTAAFAGGLLSIKPVIGIRDGAVEILGKARGSRQGNNLLVKEIQSAGGVDFDRPLLLGYTGLGDALLRKYMEDSAFLWQDNVDELRVAMVGSVVGTHAGPGAVAVAFFSK